MGKSCSLGLMQSIVLFMKLIVTLLMAVSLCLSKVQTLLIRLQQSHKEEGMVSIFYGLHIWLAIIKAQLFTLAV